MTLRLKGIGRTNESVKKQQGLVHKILKSLANDKFHSVLHYMQGSNSTNSPRLGRQMYFRHFQPVLLLRLFFLDSFWMWVTSLNFFVKDLYTVHSKPDMICQVPAL